MMDGTGKDSIGARIVALRDGWHTMKHPFFQAMTDGSLPLRALGIYMANHYKFVEQALPAFGLLFYRAPREVAIPLVENMAEEEGLIASPGVDKKPHDHMEMIFDFCAAAGLSEDEVRNTKMSPAWCARTLHYVQCLRDEPIGVALAMQSTQEGQQVALNNETTIPSFQKHYGFTVDSPEIAFFVEHAEADLEHSNRQMALCGKYITPDLEARTLEICEEAVRLRWASITEIYRAHVLNEPEILPPGIAA